LWPAVGAVVSWQVSAAFRLLTGAEVAPRMFQIDVWEGDTRTVSLQKAKREDCPTCGLRLYPALAQRPEFDTTLCGRDAVQIRPRTNRQVNLDALRALWEKVGATYRNPFLLKLQLADNEIVLFPDGRAIIKGTTDPSRARDLYAKYVGV
jgi:adenylyltransferase/sulfurtransferase